MSNKHDEIADWNASARALILMVFLPYRKPRDVHGARVWLPEGLAPDTAPGPDHDLFGDIEHGDMTLRDCIENVVIALREIEAGRSPVGAVPDFELDYGHVRFEADGDRVWLHGYTREHHGPDVDVRLLVYALDKAGSWALTLHGVWWRDDGLDPTPDEAATLDAGEPSLPSMGGAP